MKSDGTILLFSNCPEGAKSESKIGEANNPG